MSRYDYLPPGWPPHCTFVIGWDDALESYFGLVMDASIGQDEESVIASVGGVPPHFSDLDKLMRVVNARVKGKLPPVQLTRELRRTLAKDASRPVVNHITLSPPGAPVPEEKPKPTARPDMMLGSCAGYLTADGLHEVMNRMADRFFRLERLYREKKAAGLSEDDDESTRRIRTSLEQMEAIGSLLAAMAQTPDILVAGEALTPFHEISAEAERLLQTEAADANRPGETLH